MKRSSKTAGTSFYNTTLNATPQELINALGKPQYFSNDGSDKTNMDYSLETESGIPFTIYDWKEYRPLHMDEKIEFHIGGFNGTQTEEAKWEVISLINKSKRQIL